MKASYTALEQLLLHKRFDELTAQKRAQVGLDKRAYAQQRRILLDSKTLLQQAPPLVDGLAALQAQYQQHHPVVPFWQRPLPLYQGALLALGVALLVYWCLPMPPPVVQEKVVYQTQVDTVVRIQEKIVVQENVVYRTNTVRIVERDTVYLPLIDRNLFYQEAPEKKAAPILATQPKSKSMKDMQGLLDFVGVGE